MKLIPAYEGRFKTSAINDLLASDLFFPLFEFCLAVQKCLHHLLCLCTIMPDIELAAGSLLTPAVRDQLKGTTIKRFCLTDADGARPITEFLSAPVASHINVGRL